MGRAARVLILLLLLLGFAAPADAQEEPKELVWRRYDADLDVQRDGRMLVTETQEIEYLSGTWDTGGRRIPLDRVDEIEDVRVFEGNRALPMETAVEDGELQIRWEYPTAGSGDVRTFRVEYTARGVIRTYSANQDLRWIAVPETRRFPVASSTVTVRLPGNVRIEDRFLESYPERIGGNEQPIAGGAQYTVEELPAGEGFEIRAQLPAGTVRAPVPAWQARADERDRIQETVKPRNNALLFGLGVFLPIAGLIGLMTLWLTRGKDPGVGRDAEQLTEPPSDLPAPLAGVLVDERADVQDVVSTIMSLAERGVIRVTQTQNDQLLGSTTDYELTLNRPYAPEQLRTYERTFVDTLFAQGDTALLSEAKGRFMAAVPVFRDQLYEEVVHAGLFKGNPETTRNRYRSLGTGVLVLGLAFGCVAISLFSQYADPFFIIVPALGLAAIGLGLRQLSQAMPVRTLNGAVEASRWRSFRNYLAHIERTPDIAQDKGAFERYLSYATAFGLGRSWLDKFASVGTPAPAWYRQGAPMGADMDFDGFGMPHGRRGYGGGFGGPIIIVPPFGGGFGGHHGGGGDGGGAAGGIGDASGGGLFGGGDGLFDFGDQRGALDQASGGFGDLLDQASDAFGGADWGGGGSGGFGGGGGGGGADFD